MFAQVNLIVPCFSCQGDRQGRPYYTPFLYSVSHFTRYACIGATLAVALAYPLFYRFHHQLPTAGIYLHRIAVANSAIKDGASNTVLDLFLDHALEWTRSKLRIVSLVGEQVF